jgi:hypothetical protein
MKDYRPQPDFMNRAVRQAFRDDYLWHADDDWSMKMHHLITACDKLDEWAEHRAEVISMLIMALGQIGKLVSEARGELSGKDKWPEIVEAKACLDLASMAIRNALKAVK